MDDSVHRYSMCLYYTLKFNTKRVQIYNCVLRIIPNI